jgi:putative DNA primase/helicase
MTDTAFSHFTKLTAVGPADTADCPIWLQFLDDATASDHQLIRFLQQLTGYSLSGSVAEHVMAFVYGTGGNGKSVFINTVSGILGAIYPSVGTFGWQSTGLTPSGSTVISLVSNRWFVRTIPRRPNRPGAWSKGAMLSFGAASGSSFG